MQRREEEHDAEASAWARATHRVVLATNSPFVQTFFQDLARDQMGSWAIHIVTVDVSGVEVDSPCLSDAAVAVVHTDPDVPAAQAVCTALGAGWPALPIIALVSSVRAVTPWYVEALLRGELAGLLDLEATAAEVVAGLEAVTRGRVAVSVARDPVHTAALGAALLARESTSEMSRSLI